MSESSPLAAPDGWNLIDDGYAELVAPVLANYARDAIMLAANADACRDAASRAPGGVRSFVYRARRPFICSASWRWSRAASTATANGGGRIDRVRLLGAVLSAGAAVALDGGIYTSGVLVDGADKVIYKSQVGGLQGAL